MGAIVLLYGQAMADLALPDYMSRIVNVGIQYGGVETDYPIVISETDFEMFTTYADEHGADLSTSYELMEKSKISDVKFLEDARATSYYVWQNDAEKNPAISELFTDFALQAFEGTGGMATLEVNDLTRSQMAPKVVQIYYDHIGVDVEALQQSYLLSIGGVMLLVAVFGAIAS